MSPRNVVVVGAGISGLTAAYYLRRAGVEVTVLERGDAPGGTMRTVRDGDWLVETGPTSALETTPLFAAMFDGLGIGDQRLYADPASDRRYILRNGALHALPMSPGAFLASSLWTLPGKLRLLREPFIGRGLREETIAEFVERRLGREFLDYAINPFVAGVYAGNPEQLSVRAAFPKLYALEKNYGGLVRGMIGGARERKKRAEKAKDRAKMFSFAAGMETFPRAIGSFLGGALHCGTEVTGVERGTDGTWTVSYRGAGGVASARGGSVILAVPAAAAAGLVRPLDGALADSMAKVYYPPVAEVFLGFPSGAMTRSLDGFGYLIPAKERRNILGTIWSSSLFPGRAPAGHVALTTFVGGSRQPDLPALPEDEIVELVMADLRSIMGVRGAPAYRKVFRWERAIPQYNLGYLEFVGRIEALEEAHPGLFVCANYRGGIAVGDCVMSGEKTARRITESQSTR
jgi:oxygen-dependent protoporphyrinogen oxidase